MDATQRITVVACAAEFRSKVREVLDASETPYPILSKAAAHCRHCFLKGLNVTTAIIQRLAQGPWQDVCC